MSEQYYTQNFHKECQHTQKDFIRFVDAAPIKASSKKTLCLWFFSINTKRSCPCAYLETVPWMLVHNPYYSLSVSFEQETGLYVLTPDFPLVDFLLNCIEKGLLKLLIVDENERLRFLADHAEDNNFENFKSYYVIESEDIKEVIFSEVSIETLGGEEDRRFILNLMVDLEDKDAFLHFMDKGMSDAPDQDGDISIFQDAFR